MNATTLASNLHRAIYDAVHPIDENGKRENRCKMHSLPILDCVLITDHEGRIALYSHNLESAAVAYAPARIDDSFAICVPAHSFLDWMDIIKKEDTPVFLTVDVPQCLLIVKAGNARATFKCLPACEFPPVTEARENGEKDPTLASVGLAVSKDDARPELRKVCHKDGYMIGADAFRMHLAPSEKTDIPEGYPDIAPLLESLKAPEYTAIVPAAPLVKAVKNLKAVAKRGDGWITFHCNGKVEISAESEEAGTSRAEVEIWNSTGKDVTFRLQAAYVQDALSHVCPKAKTPKGKKAEPQTVTIHVTAKNSIGTPGPVWFVNGELKACIMPKLETIPEEISRPSKSELMSAYNRKRAQLRKQGQEWKIWELNQAFGNLQRNSWREAVPQHAASRALLQSIAEARATPPQDPPLPVQVQPAPQADPMCKVTFVTVQT